MGNMDIVKIQPLTIAPLHTISHHTDIDFVERFAASNFPFHLAVHQINKAENLCLDYVAPHQHECDEINIIISPLKDLKYKILIGDKEEVVTAPCSIYIPRLTTHSANAIEGSGYFICLLLDEKYDAFNG